VACLDVNLWFYEWLLSDAAAELLVTEVYEKNWSDTRISGFLQIIDRASDFRKDLKDLQHVGAVHFSALF
jgi:hypothetical protein